VDEKLIPVLQMDDIEALKAAMKHLEENGFRTDIGSFSDLSDDELRDWMIHENGGYIFFVEESQYEAAMNILGDYFGFTEED